MPCADCSDTLSTPRARRGKLALALAALMDASDRRGGDSWGYYVPADGTLSRGLGEVSRAPRPRALAGHDAIIGHTRNATTGDVTAANAHPFRFARLTGAHNGIVSNHAELARRYSRDYPVDSRHLLAHLDDGLPCDDIEAWGALSWCYHATPERVYLSRFNGGSLSVLCLAGGVLWASEEAPLRRAAALAGLRPRRCYRVDDGAVYYARAGRLYATGEDIGIPPVTTSRLSWEWHERDGTEGIDTRPWLSVRGRR